MEAGPRRGGNTARAPPPFLGGGEGGPRRGPPEPVGDAVGEVETAPDPADVLREVDLVVLVDRKPVELPVHPEEHAAAAVLLDHLPQAAGKFPCVPRPDCSGVVDADPVELIGDELETFHEVLRAVLTSV